MRLFPLSRPQDAISLSLPHVQAGVCVLEPGANQHFSSSSLRLTLSSPLLPEAVLDVDLRTGAVAERRRTVIQGRPRVNAEDFEVSRLHVPVPAGGGGADAGGVRVPVTLVRRRGAPLDGSGPLLLSGYGAYGTTQEPAFSAEHLCLLRRGWTLATAHVRGGGELGKRWHVDGRGAAKRNTFSDFAAVASHLVQRGYCAQNRLAARGVSAGGLLAGVMANEAPEGLFSALVLRVPFLDVATTMADPALPLTLHEQGEWGPAPASDGPPEALAAARAASDAFVRGYSPYDNVRARRYPPMMLTAALNDTRVGFWEAVKFAARVRDRRTDDGLLLLFVSEDEGHFGPVSARARAFVCVCVRARGCRLSLRRVLRPRVLMALTPPRSPLRLTVRAGATSMPGARRPSLHSCTRR